MVIFPPAWCLLYFHQFSRVAKAMSNGYRPELPEFFTKGERSVDALAHVSGLMNKTCAAWRKKMTIAYFVQHGIAEPKEIDETRPLSKKGIDITQQIATYLNKQDVVINEVVHSGKLRAEQTASIFAEILNVSETTALDGMKPNDDPSILIGKIKDSTMYVGHLPHVQKVISKIVTGDENNQAIAFQNSAVACIEVQENQGYLKWFITPDLCSECSHN